MMNHTYLWHEDPLLSNLYEAEIGILTRGLSGDFELVKLFDPKEAGGRIVCVGILTYDAGKRQAVQINFPTKYPYSPPRIVAVTLSTAPDRTVLWPAQPFHFGKGNQYGDGALCLFRADFWDSKQHNIGWTLRRAQKWLTSATTTGFKPDEIVEERPAPINHFGQVLLPRPIDLPPNARTGEFILTQFKPNHFILVDNELTNSPFPLKIGKEIFKWYRFDDGLKFKDLFPIFDGQSIYQVFESHFGENIVDGAQIKNIAIYLPGDEMNWHFFKVIVSNGAFGPQIAVQYFLSHTLSTELYLRTAAVFDDQVLMSKRVTIIGLGAIGSEVAKSLARNGVGHFNLFDIDTFEVGNSVRHAADLFFVGEAKVEVAKALIQRSNPNITVNAYRLDVLNDSGILEASLAASDLCLVLTGEDAVDYLVNDKYARRFDIPFVFARVAAGAVSGAIQIVDTDAACLRCLSANNLDILPEPMGARNFGELPPEYGRCSSPALPGSEIDTKEIALQTSRVALQMLLKNSGSSYPGATGRQYYWHGPGGSKTGAPFSWEVKNCEKDSNCPICNQ